jgi:hypothetical protein
MLAYFQASRPNQKKPADRGEYVVSLDAFLVSGGGLRLLKLFVRQ